MVVAITAAKLKHLRVIAKTAAENERAWLAEWEPAPGESDSPRARRVALAQARADGRVMGTRELVVAAAVRAELAERGWSARTWRPVPPGVATHAGRRLGTPDQDPPLYARLFVRLPDGLSELVRRACHWTSEPARKKLRAGAWGDARDELRRQITTPAALIRAAVDRLAAAHPLPESDGEHAQDAADPATSEPQSS